MLRYTVPFDLTGRPTITLPGSFTVDGMPLASAAILLKSCFAVPDMRASKPPIGIIAIPLTEACARFDGLSRNGPGRGQVSCHHRRAIPGHQFHK